MIVFLGIKTFYVGVDVVLAALRHSTSSNATKIRGYRGSSIQREGLAAYAR